MPSCWPLSNTSARHTFLLRLLSNLIVLVTMRAVMSSAVDSTCTKVASQGCSRSAPLAAGLGGTMGEGLPVEGAWHTMHRDTPSQITPCTDHTMHRDTPAL